MSIETNTRINSLRHYIYNIPETQGFKDFEQKYNFAKLIDNIKFPIGKHKKDIIANIQDMLPQKIDMELQKLKQDCEFVRQPWKSHIISEIDLILSELKIFRDSHTEGPQEVNALLHQLNYMSKDQ
jgi:hypothetical protein